MEINGNQLPDPVARKRLADRATGRERNPAPDQAEASGPRDAEVSIDRERIDRFVALLKDSDPTDLHRVEDLRRRIEDGSYRADVDQLIDPLLRFLGPATESGE